ncbi:MFS transporter [bacterium]|nr:MFS transporter [bacterium]
MNRWFILFILFFARTVMAFQFQSVAALSPLMVDSLALTLVDIGLLIGLYLGPGIIVAVIGGTVAAVLGDRRTVFLSLLLMLIGAAMVAQATSLNGLLAGRVVSGIGGVVVNVVMTKMVIDWFAKHDIATAMAIFIASWPMGIALALVVLPWLAGIGGLKAAWFGVTVATSIALVAFILFYRTPEGAEPTGKLKFVNVPWGALALAALVWALYNTALAMVFGFGTIILADKGLPPAQAGSATSLFMFAIVVSAPLGGWLVDRFALRDAFITTSLVAGLILLPALVYLPVTLALVAFAFAGFVVGLAAGAIASLPSDILSPETRAFGMGIFFAIYYLLMMVAPPLAGALAERLQTVDITLIIGAVMMLLALLAFGAFRRTSRSI